MESKKILTKNEGVSVANSNFNQQPIKIRGTLTSRIELRGQNTNDPYYYAFVRLDRQEVDLPVIFRIKYEKGNDNYFFGKPQAKKGSYVELEGTYADLSKGKTRSSFTAHSYQILQEPKPLTSAELITQISSLLTTSLEKKKEWTNRTDFLFKKLEELKELQLLSEFTKFGGKNFLEAHLLLKSAQYANYQTKLLNSSFNLTKYLETISQEVQSVKSHIEAYQSKQITN